MKTRKRVRKMEFKSITKNSVFFDPFNNFELTERPTEIRIDPLTGKTSRIIYFPVTLPPPPDQTALAEATKPYCPFCKPAVFERTPKFVTDIHPDGRIVSEKSVVFPNAFPYDAYSAVGVVGDEHFVAMDSFDVDVLCDSLLSAQDYLKRVWAKDQKAIHQSINMNYMPLSGGSIIHPHIQILAGDIPTNYQREIRRKTGEYRESNGSLFFTDLISEEEKMGERFIKRDSEIVWLSAFAPMGICEFISIFEDGLPLVETDRKTFQTFSRGMVAVFKYLSEMNFASFNMSIYSAVAGLSPKDSTYPTHARIVPRAQLPPVGASDINYFEMLHNEVLTIVRPEEAARGAQS
jgi:galactose-1-phosphate uridylyltransferase